MNVIQIDQLTKSFKSGWPGRPPVTALDGLSLMVTHGEIFGFLGPNGAGKTTTLKILMGLMRSDSGTIEIFGQPAGNVAVKKAYRFSARISVLLRLPHSRGVPDVLRTAGWARSIHLEGACRPIT